MKSHMANHVSDEKVAMFQMASDQVRSSLNNLCNDIKSSMLDKANSVFDHMRRDYLTILHGMSVGEIRMTREERDARRETDKAIELADGHFQDVLDADLQKLKEHNMGNQDSAVKTEEKEEEIAYEDINFDEMFGNDEGSDEEEQDDEDEEGYPGQAKSESDWSEG